MNIFDSSGLSVFKLFQNVDSVRAVTGDTGTEFADYGRVTKETGPHLLPRQKGVVPLFPHHLISPVRLRTLRKDENLGLPEA